MTKAPSSKQSLWYGFLLKCPRCGKGHLFKSYLKQTGQCADCQENFEGISADDGPAWLTILLTGHLILPLVVYCEKNNLMDLWTELVTLILATCLCVLLLLPRSKGVFIAALWVLYKRKQ